MVPSAFGGLTDGEPEFGSDAEARQQADALVASLYARQSENNVERRLDATSRVLELLGHPEGSYGVIHITGTNGKSSTARIAGSILRAHGLRVGVFTSPHLVRLNERIDIDGPISDEKLVEVWHDIEPYVLMVDAELEAEGRARLTFFEAVTVLAFAAFADAPCDVIVLEVGMGGEWDSTNVATGDVAVFAPIAMDHERYLGANLHDIAATKAGIIKPDAIVVSAGQDAVVTQQLAEHAEAANATLKQFGVDFDLEDVRSAVGGQEISVRGLAGTYRELLFPLLGEHQARNGALAIAAVEAFLGGGEQPISSEVLAEGLLRAVSPGRLQLVATDPSVIVDVAHNPHGALSLAKALSEVFAFHTTVGVVGILSDKDVVGILTEFEPVFDLIVVTASASARAIPSADLAVRARQVFGEKRVVDGGSVADALSAARELASDGSSGVVVTGSVTVVGEVMAIVGRERAAGGAGRGGRAGRVADDERPVEDTE